jgi:hypothetical protein
MYNHTVLPAILPQFLCTGDIRKNNCHPFRHTSHISGMNSSFVHVHVVCESVVFTFLSFDFYLLNPYTTKQWMTYHWCYEYHSLRNAVLEYKLSDTTFLFYTFLTVNSRPQKQLCYVINFLQPYLFPSAQSTQKREHISMP